MKTELTQQELELRMWAWDAALRFEEFIGKTIPAPTKEGVKKDAEDIMKWILKEG